MADSKPPEPRAEQEHQKRDAASAEEKSELSNSKPTEDRDEKGQVEWYERTRYQILLFTVGIALFGLFLGLILDWYIDPQTSTQKKDLVQALGLITAGVAGAVGIFFTWRGQERNQRNTQEQFRLTRQSQEQNQQSTQAQLENAQEELRLTRQGQITERFTRAIEQLGSEKLEIRLGGIYALERIDKESPERAYHPTVMEVLTAYVRENSRRDHEKPSTPTAASNEDAEHDKGVEQEEESPVRRRPTDIQAILEVLKRREEDHVPEQHRVHLDLREANLQGADLVRANLREADLRGANLRGAGLLYTDLHRANLVYADLREAHLQHANLTYANLREANLHRANLGYADLREASLQHANLYGALLYNTGLHRADLHGANLHRANLEEANLHRANLEEANLQEAVLKLANLQGANLHRAKGTVEEQLADALSLQGATMPDGQKYEDWLGTPEGQNWLRTYKQTLGIIKGRQGEYDDWLKTSEGQMWLKAVREDGENSGPK